MVQRRPRANSLITGVGGLRLLLLRGLLIAQQRFSHAGFVGCFDISQQLLHCVFFRGGCFLTDGQFTFHLLRIVNFPGAMLVHPATSRNETSDDYVLLQAPESVAFFFACCFGEHANGALEAGRRQKALRGQRCLSNAQQQWLSLCGLPAKLVNAAIFLAECKLVGDFAGEEASVSVVDNFALRLKVDKLVEKLTFELSYAKEDFIVSGVTEDQTKFSVGMVYKFMKGANINIEYNSIQDIKGKDRDPALLTVGLEGKTGKFRMYGRYEKIIEDSAIDVEENFFAAGVAYIPTNCAIDLPT